MIELRVTGDDAETIAKDIAYLAGELGLVAGAVRLERFEGAQYEAERDNRQRRAK